MTKDEALERKAENARELGLDYEPLEAKDKPSMKVEGPLHVVCQCDKCKAQPEQEPVAWMNGWGDLFKKPDEAERGQTMQPFYTTPPQRTWVGLTDEEISELIRATHNTGSFVRAIENKLKERNI